MIRHRRTSVRALCAASLGAALLAGAAREAPAEIELIEIDIELRLPRDDGGFRIPNMTEVREFFNLARCLCGDEQFAVRLQLEDPPPSLPRERVEVWVGNNCTDPLLRVDSCEQVGTFDDVNTLRSPRDLPIEVHRLAAPLDGLCEFREFTQSVFVMIDEDGDGMPEKSWTYPISLDQLEPPAPRNISVRGGDRAVAVDWNLPSERTDDFYYVQFLCARADGSVEEEEGFGTLDPRYVTSRLLCGEVTDFDVAIEPPEGEDPGELPGMLATLDPAHLCGEKEGTRTGHRIEGLENDVPYRVVMLAIDRAQNPRAFDLGVATPESSINFWDDYKNEGGGAEGGYCFVATAAYGDYGHPYVRVLRDFRDGTLARFALGRAFIRWYYRVSPPVAGFLEERTAARFAAAVLLFPVMVVAGTWEYTGVAGKLGLALAIALAIRLRRARRRRRSRDPQPAPRRALGRRLRPAAAAIALFALLAWPAGAAAQPTWWDELEEDDFVETVGPGPVNWVFELKFGPYYPDVDREFSGDVQPFRRMFGKGPFLMSQIELDRFFFRFHGDLGVGLTVGYLQTGANAYVDDGTGNPELNENGKPIRTDADRTDFRLVPTAVSAVYRYTGLDDAYGVPLVPYLKAGLAYYLWWITRPDGSIAEVEGDRARGGSLGYQAAVGLALRAERFDRGSEVSLRNELGIQHAGLFVELSLARVDGFGADDKLSVGDLTWLGGIHFEF